VRRGRGEQRGSGALCRARGATVSRGATCAPLSRPPPPPAAARSVRAGPRPNRPRCAVHAMCPWHHSSARLRTRRAGSDARQRRPGASARGHETAHREPRAPGRCTAPGPAAGRLARLPWRGESPRALCPSLSPSLLLTLSPLSLAPPPLQTHTRTWMVLRRA
jgi:hypothetical protein